MDDRIVKFILKRHILTLAVVSEDMPYLCSCFYAYDRVSSSFIIASNTNTKHIQSISKNNNIAINIYLDTKIVGLIKGIQGSGTIKPTQNDRLKDIYFSRFIYAKLLNPILYEININYIKYTDNTICFGKKLIWQRDLE